MAVYKQLNSDEFTLELLQDKGMINKKRVASLRCKYCSNSFDIHVTNRTKKQQSCIECRPIVLANKAKARREAKHNSVTNIKCTKCTTVKSKCNFSLSKSAGNGYTKICKQCAKKLKKEYLQTKQGLLTQLYNTQCNSSKKRGHSAPEYTREDLINKYINSNRFNIWYERWKQVGFPSYYDFKPSFDRIDDTKGYCFSNIRLTTYKRNFDKESLKYKLGKSVNYTVSRVKQTTLDGVYIATYHSINEAERVTNIRAANISKVCRNLRKHAGNYLWCYTT